MPSLLRSGGRFQRGMLIFNPGVKRQGMRVSRAGLLRQRDKTEALHFEEAFGTRFDIGTRGVSIGGNGPK
jgi:hypothetical protein